MYYENLTYKLAEYIHVVEKITSRKAAYDAAVLKIESANSIYNEEYKKRVDYEARVKLNTEYMSDMINFSKEIDKLNKEVIESYFKDITPSSDTSETAMTCIKYMQIRKKEIDKLYLRQLASPLIKANDYRGLSELAKLYWKYTGHTITDELSSNGIEFLTDAFHATHHQEETMRRLRLIIKDTTAELPNANLDVGSHAAAQPVFRRYGNIPGMVDYIKRLKDYLWEFDHPAEVAPIKALKMEFTPVRTPKANSGAPAPAAKSADDNPFTANFSKVR